MRELRDGELRLELAGYEVNAIHRVPTWSFRMVHTESGEELGTIRLRVGDSRHVVMYAGHVGYGVEGKASRTSLRGAGFAAAVAGGAEARAGPAVGDM